MSNNMLKQYINGRSCDILGLGVSNLPLARLLCEWGLTVTVRDKKTVEKLGDTAKELAVMGARFVTGESCFDDCEGDVLFRSPGIRPDLAGLTAAEKRGAELTGEIELFLQLTEAETFGVTGSDGKTTSTTLTGKFLAAEAERTATGRVLVGGNIGAPLLDRLGETTAKDRAVMELSSFQLRTLHNAPHYAAITNISENHMDWHRASMEEYIGAKTNIIGKTTRRLVTNGNCPITKKLAADLLATSPEKRPALYLFSSSATCFADLFPTGAAKDDRALYLKNDTIVLSDGVTEHSVLDTARIHVPGKHNLENFMTAIGLTWGKVDPSVYGTVADEFFGVEHRLERVRTLEGVDYYNSSIDSSPTRTAAALSALSGRDIVIICGGYDKKLSFAPLADALCDHVRAVVLTGATAEKIRQALEECDRPVKPQVVMESDFRAAVHAAKALARPGGCVLLSPACASFDAFKNFAQRGDIFREIVKKL